MESVNVGLEHNGPGEQSSKPAPGPIASGGVSVFFSVLLAVCVSCLALYKYVVVLRKKDCIEFVHAMGISVRKAAKWAKEFRRKMIHMSGLAVPISYYIGMKLKLFSSSFFVTILGCWAVGSWVAEFLRRISPSFRAKFKEWFGEQMRGEELEDVNPCMTGLGFYSTGAFLCCKLFSPLVAIASMLFLVLGDPAAALVGIAMGRIKIGRKSLEGFLAMFFICFAVGIVLFWQCLLPEYVAVAGAFAASLVELIAPFKIDDNLTIPLSSALALTLALKRTQRDIPIHIS